MAKRKAPPPDGSASSSPHQSSLPPTVAPANPTKRRKVGTKAAAAKLSEPTPVAPSPNVVSPQQPPENQASSSKTSAAQPVSKPRKPRPKITKLAPSRPFPQVPSGSSATGPYSSRGEGKNMIGVTKNLELGAYLRRCVDLVNVDGYVPALVLEVACVRF